MSRVARSFTAVLAVLLLALPSAARAADRPAGAESPQALVARMQAAVEGQDLSEMLACMAPNSRREMALAMVAGTGLMVAFMGMGGEMAGAMGDVFAESGEGEEQTPEQEAEAAEQKAAREQEQAALEAKAAEMQQRFEAILERHGVTEMMNQDEPPPEDPEQRAAALEKLFGETDEIALAVDLMALMDDLGESEETPIPSPVPVTEVSDYEIDGDRATARAGEETIELVRIDGRWYFEPGDDVPGATPPAP